MTTNHPSKKKYFQTGENIFFSDKNYRQQDYKVLVSKVIIMGQLMRMN